MIQMLSFFATCLIVTVSGQSVLTSVSFPSTTTSTQLPPNIVGVSLSFDQIQSSALISTVFKGYLSNFMTYGNMWASAGKGIKVQYPPGYKYDCTTWSTMINENATCTMDIQMTYPTISSFFSETSATANGLSIGFDREGAMVTLTDPNFMNYLNLYVFFGLSSLNIGNVSPVL